MPRRGADRRPGVAPLVTVDVRVAIRGAESDADRNFVRMLGRRSAVSSVSTLRPASEVVLADAFERLFDIVERQSHVTFIACAGEERVGFLLMLDRLPDEVTLRDQAFIAYMAVEPGWQAKGVGSALLSAAENEARHRRLPHVTLMVSEENDAARRLYERAGYHTERRLMCKPL